MVRLLAGAIAFVLAANVAALATVDNDEPEEASPRPLSTTTTTVAPEAATSTTGPPETTTTTAPAPAPVVSAPVAPNVALAGSDAKAVVTPSGVVVAVVGPAPGGLEVLTPCERRVVLTAGVPVRAAMVVVDAGHGGSESGATGSNGLREKTLDFLVANHTVDALQAAGVTALPTRTGDYRMTLEARAALGKALKPRAFVSIHHNGEPDRAQETPGTETYYQVASPTSGESKRLAGLIYEEVVRALAAFPTTWHADNDAGTKYRRNVNGDDYYGILRRTKGVTAVLAELAFLSSSPGEAETLARTDVQRAEGAAVARAIVRFLRTADPGSGFVEPYDRPSPGGSSTGGPSNCVDPPL